MKGPFPRHQQEKRWPFGLKPADDTDHFRPINVSLGSSHADAPAQSSYQTEDEYFPDEAEADQTRRRSLPASTAS